MADISKIQLPDSNQYNVKDLDTAHSISYGTIGSQLVVYHTKNGASGTGFLTINSTATQNSNNPITSGYVYTLYKYVTEYNLKGGDPDCLISAKYVCPTTI